VQGVHRPVTRMLCNAFEPNCKSPVFMRYFAVSHMLMLAIFRHARKIQLCKSSARCFKYCLSQMRR